MPQEIAAPNYSEQEQIRRAKLDALREKGQDPYLLTKCDVDAKSADIVSHFDEMEGKEVALAGRMISRRVMGKAAFAHLLDAAGDIQF